MSKKLGYLFAFIYYFFGAAMAVSAPQHLVASAPKYLNVKLDLITASMSEPEFLKYSQAKLLFDSYLNYDYFQTHQGFFEGVSGNNVYDPMNILKSWYFNDVFGVLSECECIAFDRKSSPIRKFLEKELFAKFEVGCLDKNKQIIYTSVGSGSLFQDLIIITKLLQYGYRDIVINLIDDVYKNFMESAREACVSGPFFVSNPGRIDDSPDQSDDQSEKNFEIHFKIFYYFLKWISFLRLCYYNDLAVSLFVYSDLADYIDDCRTSNNDLSDIGIITDIDGDFGAGDDIDFDELFMKYCHPFYRSFFDYGIKLGGIYGFALIGDFKDSNGTLFTDKPVWTTDVNVADPLSSGFVTYPLSCLCGIKQPVSI